MFGMQIICRSADLAFHAAPTGTPDRAGRTRGPFRRRPSPQMGALLLKLFGQPLGFSHRWNDLHR
jgi:hypothetical protein